MFTENTSTSIGEGCGGIVATKGDVSAFFTALLGGKFGQDILSQMTDLKDFYGRGLFANFDSKEIIGYGHDGAIDAFRAAIKQGDYMIVLLANSTGFNSNAVVWAIQQTLSGGEFDIPNLNFLSLEPSKLKPLEGNYIGIHPATGSGSIVFIIRSNGKCLTLTPESPDKKGLKMEPYSATVFYNPEIDLSIKYVNNNNDIEIRDGGFNMIFSRKKQN